MLDLRGRAMGFDPKVLESIQEYRGKTRRNRLLLMTPFVLAVLFSLAMLLVTVLAGKQITELFRLSDSNSMYLQNQTVVFVKFIAGLLAVVLVAGFGYN